MVEVNRPNRFDRRARGKTDTFDACLAAEEVLTARAGAAPKGADGLVEALRVLRTTRTSALRERTATINQIKALLVAGPEWVRAKYRGLSNIKLIAALAASRPPPPRSPQRRPPPTPCAPWRGVTNCSLTRSKTSLPTCGGCSRPTPWC